MLIRQPKLVRQMKWELYGLLGDSLVEAKTVSQPCAMACAYGVSKAVSSKCRELTWLLNSIKANSGLRKDLLVLFVVL